MNDIDSIKDTLLHSGIEDQTTFVCSRCGHDVFEMIPSYEPNYDCTWASKCSCRNCGKITTLNLFHH